MTTAVTPNAPHHLALGPLDSRIVRTEELPWQPTRLPGIEVKTLMVDRSAGLATTMMRMALSRWSVCSADLRLY